MNIKEKLMRKTVIFGKSVPVFLIASLMLTGLGSAALVGYYGRIQATVNIQQSVTFSDLETDKTYSFAGDVMAGNSYTDLVSVINNANVPANAKFVTSYSPDGVGITTTYLKAVDYSFADVQNVNDGTVGQLEVTVTEDGDWMVWTFDFPVELFTGDGNLNVGLIIATDGDGNGPAFQIHNNDGADATYDWGTWLMSPWGPTIDVGWFGWHSGDTNTPVTELAWIEATGNRNVPHGEGVLQVKILKSELGESFHWAASPTVGSGFYAPAYDVTMQIPTTFGWGTPLVDMATSNYVYAELMEELLEGVSFQIESGQTIDFAIVNDFSVALDPLTYIITTYIVPVV